MKNTLLKIFFVCLFSCAFLFLFALWGFSQPPEILMRSVITFFVVGLTCFLVWLVPTIRDIWQDLKDKGE